MTKLTGLEKVMQNLHKRLERVRLYTLKGLIESAIDIRRDMDTVPPLIPVDTGNLRASFFVVSSLGKVEAGVSGTFVGKREGEMTARHREVVEKYRAQVVSWENPAVILGFSARYAIYVHEMYGAKFKRPGAGPGFFAVALNRNKRRILENIKRSIEIK